MTVILMSPTLFSNLDMLDMFVFLLIYNEASTLNQSAHEVNFWMIIITEFLVEYNCYILIKCILISGLIFYCWSIFWHGQLRLTNVVLYCYIFD